MYTYIILIALIVIVNCDNDTAVLKLVEKYEFIELGKNITLKVLDPDKIPQPYRLPQTPAEAFIYDIYRYHNRLNTIYIMMLSGSDEGQKVFQYLYDHDGPQHLSLHLDYHFLTNYYNFEENDLVDIKDILEYTKRLWLKMCKTLTGKNSGESKKSNDLDVEESLNKLELIPLGKNITRQISEKEKVTNRTLSDLFLNDIYKYKNRLDSLILMVRFNNSKGTMVYNDISQQGGPPHINMKINYNRVKNIYDFSDEEIEEMELIINKTRTNWKELVSLPKSSNKANWW